jgi:acyl carrier protein
LDDLRARLVRCFSLVFPGLPTDVIPRASAETVDSWDSVNLVTLLAVIEEEFGTSLMDAEPDELTDFGSVLETLERRLGLHS